ncbi:MAG TPA: SDR family NAD(P)-dependent oxidoreductase [Conexibacter sp.]|jgi:NAD(P)-dependent dehydrogenase (short-subunit alcohol dehydrogenase family)
MTTERIDFDGEVAIVTGAGRGIGRGHALELARRGARVVVNDVDRAAADTVVEELLALGAAAVPSYASAATGAGAQALIADALAAFGTLDALVNNAGVMRNGMIEDLSEQQLDAVLDVNLRGVYLVTQAAWPIMREKAYGRVVMTSSAGGMFAMQGESNYAASKGGVYGLAKALASEGAPHGIRVNTILPMAATAMGADDPVPGHRERYPAWVGEALRPRRVVEAVSPLVALLASRDCPVNGEAFAAGFGRFARVFVGETRGWAGEDPHTVSAEDVLAHFDAVRDLDGFGIPADIYEELEHIGAAMGVERPS